MTSIDKKLIAFNKRWNITDDFNYAEEFEKFKNGILNVSVDSSTWLYYLSLQKKELLKKMRGLTDKVKDIRFSLGE